MMIKQLKTKPKHANTPLSFDEACRRYVEWAELEAAKHGEVLYGVPTPSTGLSVLVGSTWHLRNVNGPLAKIGANGRVWRSSSEDT
jgi:hypothetical protein